MKFLILITTLLLSFNVSADTSQFKLELIFAKRGDVSAQFRVATAYEDGLDVKKDLKQAFDWYMKAAKQSHAPSQYKIGLYYEKGFGVAKNDKEALTWYNKAKENGSTQASQRLDKSAFEKEEVARKQNQKEVKAKLEQEERAQNEAKLAKEKQLASLRAAEAKKAADKKVYVKSQPTAKKIVAKAEPKIAAASVSIPDLMNVILKNQWKNKDGAADYLPSSATTCLESAENELTCFSSEKSRKVNGINVKYTAKSTVVDFKSNGSFKVIYNYNGIEVPSSGNTADEYGLILKHGWQEPALAVNCQAKDRKNVSCTRNGKQIEFRI